MTFCFKKNNGKFSILYPFRCTNSFSRKNSSLYWLAFNIKFLLKFKRNLLFIFRSNHRAIWKSKTLKPQFSKCQKNSWLWVIKVLNIFILSLLSNYQAIGANNNSDLSRYRFQIRMIKDIVKIYNMDTNSILS